MAEGLNLNESLAELEREIICAICQERYVEPKLLPCGHYFCKNCILKLVLRMGSDQPFSCPECREEVLLPKGSVDKLKTAFFINRIKGSIAILEGAHGKVVQHEACTESGAKAEDSLAKKCPAHKEPLIVYCFDCGSLICSHCTVKDHNGHKLEFNKIAAPDTRKKIMEKLKPLRELNVSLSHAVVQVQTTKCELEAQGLSVVRNIQVSFLELQKILEDCKRELLEETSRRIQEKMDRLSLQEESLSLACAEVQSVLNHIEQCVGHHTDSEFMGMHAELACQIQQGVEEHDEGVVSLEPVEKVDIGVEVRCAEALQQLCQTKAKLTQLSTVISDRAKTDELDKISACTLTTVKCNSKVDCHLKSLYNGSSSKCCVDQTGARNYCIQYTPTVRGRCELTVSVDGQEVADSPFPMFVSVPVAQLGRPVSVWRGLLKPTGVAINSVGEIIYSEGEGHFIIIIDKEGNILRNVCHQLTWCHGVAVDGDDNIYGIDLFSNKIMRCNRNGDSVEVHTVKQVQGSGHYGVAVVRDEVMVCESGNKGTIMVYDRELKYVRQITGGDMGIFYDLTPDSHGNLYVTDYANSVIRVFSIDGDLLRSFGCDENGVKRLSRPSGVCVAGQHVCVTDGNLHNVSIFTTEGVYVTSFGHKGSKDGYFIDPIAVCVDTDDFVYIADLNNGRIQIF